MTLPQSIENHRKGLEKKRPSALAMKWGRRGLLFLFLSVVVPGCKDHTVKASETDFWQAAINRASEAGGGIVSIPRGRHVTGTLFLKNDVTLRLEKGCILEGSTNRTDYSDVYIEFAEVPEPWQGLIVADGQHDVAVEGEGIVFGNGAAFPFGERVGRPRGLLFHKCKDVRIDGVTCSNLASRACYLKECDGVTVRNLTVDSHANANNDGIDIDSKNVRIENCDIDSDDDGIVFKSDNADFVVENVIVRNCRVRSLCSAVKFGTGSHGGFRDILVENVASGPSNRELVNPKTGKGHISEYRVATWPGSDRTPSLLTGIAIECVDGGLVENMTLRNITIDRAATPIFIRGGLRCKRFFGSQEPLPLPFGHHKRVSGITLENIRATASSHTASSITGVPGLRLADISFRNILIDVPGSGEAGLSELNRPVPEKTDAYPESNMFDHRMLPAYGFFIRHVDNVSFDNVSILVDGEESRPEIVAEDVTSFFRHPDKGEPEAMPTKLK